MVRGEVELVPDWEDWLVTSSKFPPDREFFLLLGFPLDLNLRDCLKEDFSTLEGFPVYPKEMVK